MILRAAWILGFLSTREYDMRLPGRPALIVQSRIKTLERSLWEDRLAIVLFLIGALILVYTFRNAPALN